MRGGTPISGVFPRRRGRRLPPLLWMVLGGALLGYMDVLLPWLPLPVRASALGWLLPLAAALCFLAWRGRLSFPLGIWLPWSLWVGYYAVGAEAEHAFHRSVMLLTPLAVGAAVSALRPGPALPGTFGKWMGRYALLFLLVAGLGTGFLENLRLGGPTGFAAGAMTAVLLACWFASRFAVGRSHALRWWGLMVLIPFVALTRTAMAAAVATLPLTLAPLRWRRRLGFLLVLLAAGLAAFQTERVQAKMFYSGHGTLADAAQGIINMFQGKGGDFADKARWAMNAALLEGIEEAPWLGHGANASEEVSVRLAGVTHPHNDWLRLGYDYGGVGVLLFVIALLGQIRHALRRARRAGGEAAIWLYAGASAFLPMALLMLTDNVVLYAAFFGNLQFMMLGFGYAMARSQRVRAGRAGGTRSGGSPV